MSHVVVVYMQLRHVNCEVRLDLVKYYAAHRNLHLSIRRQRKICLRDRSPVAAASTVPEIDSAHQQRCQVPQQATPCLPVAAMMQFFQLISWYRTAIPPVVCLVMLHSAPPAIQLSASPSRANRPCRHRHSMVLPIDTSE